MRVVPASAPALLSGALEAWERGLDDREAELAAKLLVAPRDAPCTRIDRDAPCTRILWLLDGPRRCPRGRRRGCRRCPRDRRRCPRRTLWPAIGEHGGVRVLRPGTSNAGLSCDGSSLFSEFDYLLHTTPCHVRGG